MRASVNKIIPYSFIDGPGSRMVIFMQGCNMHCLYCHNPETQSLCNNCGACIASCPQNALYFDSGEVKYDRTLCIGCDTCIRICPNHASPKYTDMDMSEVYDMIFKNADFLDGITVSGGECTLQHEFIYSLFKKVKENTSLTTFVDTNGTMPFDVTQKLCTVTDGFLLDIKCFSDDKHIILTGLSNDIVLRNAKYISDRGLLFEVRTVLAEGFTDSTEEVESIAGFIKGLNDTTLYRLIPFSPLGVRGSMAVNKPLGEEKYKRLQSAAASILGNRVIIINK